MPDVGGKVPAEVVDRIERDIPCRGVRLGGRHAHQQRTGQTGADRGGQ